MFAVGGVVLVVGRCHCRWWGGVGHCHHSWDGAGPGSSSLMLGVVMGHHLGGWWWALVAIHVDTLPLRSIVVNVVAVCLSLSCCVGSQSDDEHAMSLMWHLAPGLANSNGEGGPPSLLSIVWWPCRQLQHGNLGSHRRCLVSMWPVV